MGLRPLRYAYLSSGSASAPNCPAPARSAVRATRATLAARRVSCGCGSSRRAAGRGRAAAGRRQAKCSAWAACRERRQGAAWCQSWRRGGLTASTRGCWRHRRRVQGPHLCGRPLRRARGHAAERHGTHAALKPRWRSGCAQKGVWRDWRSPGGRGLRRTGQRHGAPLDRSNETDVALGGGQGEKCASNSRLPARSSFDAVDCNAAR